MSSKLSNLVSVKIIMANLFMYSENSAFLNLVFNPHTFINVTAISLDCGDILFRDVDCCITVRWPF